MSGAITAVAVAVGITTMELFTAVAITGAVVGAVGAVTHVKELQYAGMALGAVGGIGALAVSAGMFAAEGAALAGLDASGSAIGGAGAWGDVTAVGSLGAGAGGAYTPAEAMGMATGFEPGSYVVNPVGTPLYQDVISTVAGGGGLDAAAGVPMPVAEAATSPNVLPQAGSLSQDEALTLATAKGEYAPTQVGDPGGGLTLGGDMPAGGPTQIPEGDGSMLAPGDVARTAGQPGSPSPAVATPTEGVTPPSAAPAPATQGGVTGVPAGQAPPSGMVRGADGMLTPAMAPQGFKMPPPTIVDPASGAAIGGTMPKSAWGSIMDFLGKPGAGTLVGGSIQAVGSFLAGAMDPKNEALIKASQAQAAQNLAAVNLYNEQARKLANEQAAIASGIPVATKRPAVTGAPAGLINSAPKPAVTGVV